MPNNIRISLKIDVLSNWNNSDIILNNGEFAIIQMPNGISKIKIGNGTDLVSALPFLNEQEFFTNSLSANSLNIGKLNSNVSYSLVNGLHLTADATNSTVLGFNAKANSTDQRAFVWNGKNLYGTANTYVSHGQGTFSLNPENGISGLYIGEDTLASLLTNVYVNGEKTNNLQVVNISQDDYYNLVTSEGSIDPNTIYIVSSDFQNMYDQQIKNLSAGSDLHDAVNVEQLCSAISSIEIPEIPTDISEFNNDEQYTKVSVDGNATTEFEIKRISQEEYHELVTSEDGINQNTLYVISSDAINAYGEQIKNLADGTISSDAVNLRQLNNNITDFQVIRPSFSQNIKLRVKLFTNQELTDCIGQIESSPEYMSVYNNSPEYFSWSEFPTDGLNANYSNCPVLIKLSNWLADNNLKYVYDRLFISYVWYYNVDGEEHVSDQYSIVVPSYTEVGANASDYITKAEHSTLIQEIFKDTYTCTFNDENMYICYSNKINIIPNDISGIVPIFLNDFSKTKQYDIKFTTGNSKTILEFYYENGINGIEINDEWNINKNYKFDANKTYFIQIKQDFIQVIENKYEGGAASGNHSYKLIQAELLGTTSLTCNIENRSITTITINDVSKPLTINLPEKIDGYARDFILRIEKMTEENGPTLTYVGLDDLWTPDSEDESWLILEPGINVISFTEMQ